MHTPLNAYLVYQYDVFDLMRLTTNQTKSQVKSIKSSLDIVCLFNYVTRRKTTYHRTYADSEAPSAQTDLRTKQSAYTSIRSYFKNIVQLYLSEQSERIWRYTGWVSHTDRFRRTRLV